MATPLLFLGGAGLTDWVWEDVRRRLEVDSAVARYPTRTGAGLDDYATEVLSQVDRPTVTLVAHSLGGVVASQIVARAPERVDGVLAISGCIPAEGRSFLGSLPKPQGFVLGVMMRALGTRPPDKQIRSGLGAGLPDHVGDRLVAEFSPESRAVYRDPVSPRTFPAHRGYLFTSRDNQFPAPYQERFAHELDATWTRTLDAGHLPMLEDPVGLAAMIGDFDGTQAS
ncbi:MAG TPA: alpha/beta hydrolase [Nocardioidaceae bacterium]|nr:alpha/beta hydrolase [Nocardioidaceae bacterium]